MIKSVKVTNSRQETIVLELRSPEQSGLYVRRIDGLGLSKVDVNMSESLYEDGSYFNTARATNRNLVFSLGFLDTKNETIEEIRRKTYRFFPSKKEIRFDIETDMKRVYTTGYLESNEPDIFSKESGCVISVICPDAYFKDETIVETTLSGLTGGFEFPFSNESIYESLLEFATIFTNSNAIVSYAGDADTGVIFVITFIGSVTNITINNLTDSTSFFIDSSKVASITGSNFTNGDILTISTLKGSRYINLLRGSTNWNILNAVSTTSKWFTISKGTNIFSVTASAGIGNLSYSILSQALYEGI
jgi:hypothetical protein